jgi:hypothetical protein
MSIPTSYTEEELAAYMDTILGPVADALNWSVAGNDYAEPVNSAILSYGVDDIAEITGRDNIAKLRAIARAEVWRAVVDATSGHYDFSDGGVSLKRSQMNAQARENAQAAEFAAYSLGAYGNEVVVDNIHFVNDPYAYVDDDDRILAP